MIAESLIDRVATVAVIVVAVVTAVAAALVTVVVIVIVVEAEAATGVKEIATRQRVKRKDPLRRIRYTKKTKSVTLAIKVTKATKIRTNGRDLLNVKSMRLMCAVYLLVTGLETLSSPFQYFPVNYLSNIVSMILVGS